MTIALHKIRCLNLYVSSQKAATMVNRDITWVQKNKNRFVFRRKNSKRNLEFELSSVLEVSEKISPDGGN